MTADYNGWNDAPEAEREAMDIYSGQEFERESRARLIIQARLQLLKHLERRKQSAAAVHLLSDSVTPLAA